MVLRWRIIKGPFIKPLFIESLSPSVIPTELDSIKGLNIILFVFFLKNTKATLLLLFPKYLEHGFNFWTFYKGDRIDKNLASET